MTTQEVLVQREWTDQELLNAGFTHYTRRKYLVLARELPPEEAPLEIRNWQEETLIATAGYMICFQAGWRRHKTLYEYFHWPVAADHFRDIYRPWDDPKWKPRKWGEKHLVRLGCKPYFNVGDVWARKLEEPVWIQGVEHDRPHEVPVGGYLIIGAVGSTRGAPWWITEKGLQNRYIVEQRISERNN